MINGHVNGVIEHADLNRKDDHLFRISIKCLIRDSKGNVLVVKENNRTWWDLPGGGMDHEESIEQAVRRELIEEVSLKGDFTYKTIAMEEPFFLEHAKVWQVRIVLEVMPENMQFEPGEDGEEVRFIDASILKDSGNSAERKVYEYSQI